MKNYVSTISLAGLLMTFALVAAQEPAKPVIEDLKKATPAKAGCCCAAKSDVQVKAETAVKPDATFSVEGMSCAGCAAKIGQEVSKLDGVQKATADVKTGELLVVAKKDQKVSMKAVWETVVKAGYKPTKLVTAAGTFKEMPKE